MSHRIPRFAAVLIGLSIAWGIGCGGGSSAKSETAEAPAPLPVELQEPKDAAEAKQAPKSGEPTIQASNPEMEKIAAELVKGRSAQDQQKIYESQQHYDLALKHHNRGEFEKAKIEAQLAVQAYPENLQARKPLNDILQVTVRSRPEFGARAVEIPLLASPFFLGAIVISG